jgi:hypothetical protein
VIQLARNKEGKLIILSNQPFPADVRRVEYYREQRVMMLTYKDPNHEGDLMPCEISEETDRIIRNSPGIMVIAMAGGDEAPYGYEAPLVQIGI